METWPEFLPKPTQAYTIQPDTQVVANSFEAGPPVQRLRFDDQIDYVTLSWEFSEYEFAIFKEWFATKLAFGTKKFTMTIPLGGLDGEQQYECEFDVSSSPYSAKYKSVNYWTVSMKLFVEEVPFVSSGVLDIILEDPLEKGTSFVDSVDRLDDFIENNLTD